jgi:hypothetical protein
MAIMKYGMDHLLKLRLTGLWSSGLFGILIAVLGAGCAHSDKHKADELPARVTGIPAPTPPTFLNGALAVLLTNVDGFRARVVLEGPASADRSGMITGELMGRSSKLLFAPEPGTPKDKYSRVEDFSYIWNVDENRGFLLSGPLQGYAPISSTTHFTNVVSGGSGSSPEKVSGYLCQKSEVKVIASDGTETAFQVWRAVDLKGMPVRIKCSVNGTPHTLTLSKIRLESPPDDLFLPPSDFTKYASAETMMNELVARQQNLKRKRGLEPLPSDEIGFRDAEAPRRPQ